MQDINKALNISLPSPLEPLHLSTQGPVTPSLFVKRDDLIHPIISGNKWRKLQHVISDYDATRYNGIVSFGGGYSNHLHALGYVCQQLNIPFCACIRGDYSKNLTPMLQDLITWTSQLQWLTKLEYQRKTESAFLTERLPDLQTHLLIPEGGSDQQALTGMAKMVSELPQQITHIICPVASGGTLAGIIQAVYQSKRTIQVTGIAVLQGKAYLENLVSGIVLEKDALNAVTWQIWHEFHHGGYGKRSPELLNFCQQFEQQYRIPIEPIYSGKMFYGAIELLARGEFAAHDHICLVHTGGLQGARN